MKDLALDVLKDRPTTMLDYICGWAKQRIDSQEKPSERSFTESSYDDEEDDVLDPTML